MSKARELANLMGTPTVGNILLNSTAGDALDGTGVCNFAAGLNALGAATSGDDNVAIGRLALGAGTLTGDDNVAIGATSMDALTSGKCNIGIGISALGAATDNCDNIAIGQAALAATVNDADNNVAIGKTAMGGADVSGESNIAIGTTSADALTSGACNVAIGLNAYGAATTGCLNIAIGQTAMGATVVTGSNNIAIGTTSLDALLAGTDNIGLGLNAAGAVTSGSHNIAIGNGAGVGVTTEDKTINIGCDANQTTASVACIVAVCVMAAQFTATSDCRSKKNIKDLSHGLDFINLLRPVSYKWKPQPDKLDKDGNLIEKGEGSHRHQRTMFGLLGQQVKGALDKLGLGYNDYSVFSDQEYENKDNPTWKKSYTMEDKTIQLTYDDFIAPLIKSVQELSTEVDSLKKQLKTT